jgi:Group II intron, maturase-specific domain
MRSIGGWPNTTLMYRLNALPMMSFVTAAVSIRLEGCRRNSSGVLLNADSRCIQTRRRLCIARITCDGGNTRTKSFDFLGYTFRPRLAMNRWGKTFVNFSPGTSNRAAKAIRQTVRDWKLDCRIDKRIDELAKIYNPIIRGWIMYYGRYHKSALSRVLMQIDLRLACWAMSKYRRLRGHRRRARCWIQDIRRREPALFAHWTLL